MLLDSLLHKNLVVANKKLVYRSRWPKQRLGQVIFVP